MAPPPWVANLEAKDLLSSREVDWMIYAYLNEAGLPHTAYMLLHEAGLLPKAAQVDAVSHDAPASSSGGAAPGPDAPLQVPPGHLVRMLVKGILFYHSEAYVNGAALDRPLRITDCVPGSAMSKHQIAPLPHDKKELLDAPTRSFVKRRADDEAKGSKKKERRDDSSGTNGSAKMKSRKASKAANEGVPGESAADSAADSAPVSGPSEAPASDGAASAGAPSAGAATADAASANATDSTTSAAAPTRESPTPMDVDKGTHPDSHASTSAAASAATPHRSPTPSPGPSPPPGQPRHKSKVVVQTRAVPRKPVQRSPLPPPAGIQEAHGASTRLPKADSRGDKPESSKGEPSKGEHSKGESSKGESSKGESSNPEPFKRESPAQDEVKSEPSSSSAHAAPSVQATPSAAASSTATTDAASSSHADETPLVHLSTHSKDVVLLSGHSKRSIQMCAWNPLNPEGLASMSHDATLRIWEVPELRDAPADQVVLESKISPCRHSSLNRKNVAVTSGEWDPSGSLIATGDLEGHARVWTPSGEMPIFMTRHKESLVAIKWNAAGTSLLTASEDATICLWNLDNGRVRSQWSTGGAPVTDVDWHTDASFAAATQDGTVLLFSVHQPQALARFKLHADDVNVIRFSPDGTLIASAGDDGRVFVSPLVDIPGLPLPPGSSTARAREIAALSDGRFALPHSAAPVHSLQWFHNAPEGPRILATGSRDGHARVWNVDAGALIYDLAHRGPVYSAAFHPGLPLLATGAADGCVRVWRLPGVVGGDGAPRELLLEYEQQDEVFDVYWNPHRLQLAASGPADTISVVPVRLS